MVGEIENPAVSTAFFRREKACQNSVGQSDDQQWADSAAVPPRRRTSQLLTVGHAIFVSEKPHKNAVDVMLD